MNIKKEDLETLKDIELYLYNRNLNKMVVFENNFAIRKKDIGDLQAYNLYIKLYSLIEKLETKKKETNQINYERIKAKRKENKNYARKKRSV